MIIPVFCCCCLILVVFPIWQHEPPPPPRFFSSAFWQQQWKYVVSEKKETNKKSLASEACYPNHQFLFIWGEFFFFALENGCPYRRCANFMCFEEKYTCIIVSFWKKIGLRLNYSPDYNSRATCTPPPPQKTFFY